MSNNRVASAEIEDGFILLRNVKFFFCKLFDFTDEFGWNFTLEFNPDREGEKEIIDVIDNKIKEKMKGAARYTENFPWLNGKDFNAESFKKWKKRKEENEQLPPDKRKEIKEYKEYFDDNCMYLKVKTRKNAAGQYTKPDIVKCTVANPNEMSMSVDEIRTQTGHGMTGSTDILVEYYYSKKRGRCYLSIIFSKVQPISMNRVAKESPFKAVPVEEDEDPVEGADAPF